MFISWILSTAPGVSHPSPDDTRSGSKEALGKPKSGHSKGRPLPSPLSILGVTFQSLGFPMSLSRRLKFKKENLRSAVSSEGPVKSPKKLHSHLTKNISDDTDLIGKEFF